VSSPWYETFFDEIALDIWQDSRSEEQTAAEVDYLEAALGGRDRRRLLDLACGNGRHAVLLAARGHAMTGLDIAEGNRARGARRAAAAGVEVEWITGDMSRLEVREPFDGAYLWGNSFGYFPRVQTAQFMASVARALEVGGRFVIETNVAAETILSDLAHRTWMRVADHTLVLLEGRYIARESRLDHIYTTIRDDRVVAESTAHIWIYTCGEIVAMAEAAGFEVLDLHGNLDSSRFELGDDQLIFLLERRR
jgi:SAM-dependent methyltransferase